MVGIKHASLILAIFLTSELALMPLKVALADPFLSLSQCQDFFSLWTNAFDILIHNAAKRSFRQYFELNLSQTSVVMKL